MTSTSLYKENYYNISNAEKTQNNNTFFAHFRKIANTFKLGIFAFGIILFFNNCDANLDIIEESNLEQKMPPVLSAKISFKQAKHFSEINDEIKSIQTKFNKKQTSKENQSEIGSLKILTDEVLYVTYAGTHTYTFKVARKNPTYLLENIVLHYNLRTNSYDEYLMQYKDIKEQDIKAISEGKLFQDSKKVIVTKLENGFFESHSSSNKSSSTSKASSVICNTVTSTVFVSCGSGDHHSGNLGSWGECKLLSSLPYAYQSSSTTCVATTATTPIPQETADPSTSGGGNDPDVVIYNPLPLEPCDTSNEVDLNGNCIQQIDIAVSYIANCLSGNYSTILSQSEINFLYSTNSSFEIKNYLQNNGSSSESSSFVKDLIDLAATESNAQDTDNILQMCLKLDTAGDNLFKDSFALSLDPYVDLELAALPPDFGNMFALKLYFNYRSIRQLNPEYSRAKCLYYASKDIIHIGLDAFGLIPVLGEVADLTNGVLYTIEGDKINAALSYAGTVPLTGWAATGIKYAVKIKTAYGMSNKVKLVWKVLADGTIYFGTNNTCRAQLRKALGMIVGNLNQAHHIIPLNLQSNTIVQKAFKSDDAFHLNEALNGIPLSTAVHNGSHSHYDNLISDKLRDFAQANPNATTSQCYNKIIEIISQIRIAIANNPNTPINQLNF